MSRLYEILKRLEETQGGSPSDPVPYCPRVEERGRWWRSYRLLVILGVVTFVVALVAGWYIPPRVLTLRGALSPHMVATEDVKNVSSGPPPPDQPSQIAVESSSVQVAMTPSDTSREGGDATVRSTAVVTGEDRKRKESVGERALSSLRGGEAQRGGKSSHSDGTPVGEPKKVSSKASKVPPRTVTPPPTQAVRKEQHPPPSTHGGGRPSAPVPSEGILIMAEESRRMGDVETTIRLYRQYLTSHRDPLVMNNLGALLITRGRPDEARQVLREALSYLPDPGIAANLVAAELMAGNRGEACAILSRFRESLLTLEALRPFTTVLRACPSGGERGGVGASGP